jgi:anti-sigma factor RsiW
MKCLEAKRVMSSYLDCEISRNGMSALQVHLQSCRQCMDRFRALQRTKSMLGNLGRKSVPPELALRLRVAVSQEIAAVRRSRWEMLRVHWDNAVRALMVPATGGLVTAVLTFGLLINLLMPIPVLDTNDVPTTFYTPPQLQTTPFELAVDTGRSEPLIVEALVGADGRVQDYRILSGGDNDSSSVANLKNMLIFATFRPATSFGRPTTGRTILAFSKIQVRG